MVVRRRLIFWLIRAYIAKWGKTIFISFLTGLIVFFVILFTSRYFMKLIPIYKHAIIGITGVYTTDNLPSIVINNISRGLTEVDSDGVIKPAIASSWEIQDNGKKYIFYLKKDQYFSDGRNITSDLINYNFSDVTTEHPDRYTIVYKLKDTYAPFLITVTRPIFQPGLIGSGDYKIDDIKLNGDFIQSLTLVGVKDKFDIRTYEFYPSTEALKYAYILGDITSAVGLDNIQIQGTTYNVFPNTKVTKKVNYNKLVTLFYNNNDNSLSDKKIRLALSYALPNEFKEGEKAFLPYSPKSIFFNKDLEEKKQNYEHAKLLLDASNTATDSAVSNNKISVKIKTLSKYHAVADEIAKSYSGIGVNTEIEDVDQVPADFQIYLGDFTLSEDPDQYLLWHSGQSKNITKYKNLRIDKLLEDGRKTIDTNERLKIYNDFQKFLIEDAPASFLYFPVEYDLKKIKS